MTKLHTAFPLAPAIIAVLLLAACADAANQQTPPQAAVAGEPVPASVEQARTQCWMRYETKSAPRDLDKRMVLVDKCIEEKMKQMQTAH